MTNRKILIFIGIICAFLVGGGILWMPESQVPVIKISSVSRGSLHTVFVEKMHFEGDDGYGGQRGWMVSGSFGISPSATKAASLEYMGLSPRRLPTKTQAKWYDPTDQCLYEAELSEPDISHIAHAVIKQQPPRKYRLKLVLFLNGSELELWLNGHYSKHPEYIKFTEKLSSARANCTPSPPEVAKYAETVQRLIEENVLPADTVVPGDGG